MWSSAVDVARAGSHLVPFTPTCSAISLECRLLVRTRRRECSSKLSLDWRRRPHAVRSRYVSERRRKPPPAPRIRSLPPRRRRPSFPPSATRKTTSGVRRPDGPRARLPCRRFPSSMTLERSPTKRRALPASRSRPPHARIAASDARATRTATPPEMTSASSSWPTGWGATTAVTSRAISPFASSAMLSTAAGSTAVPTRACRRARASSRGRSRWRTAPSATSRGRAQSSRRWERPSSPRCSPPKQAASTSAMSATAAATGFVAGGWSR